MLDLAQMKKLDVWYSRLDIEARLRRQMKKGQVRRFEQNVAKARFKDSMKAFNKLVQVVDGHPHRHVTDHQSVRDQAGCAGPIRPQPPPPAMHLYDEHHAWHTEQDKLSSAA
jgi:hypothetical protein